MITKMLMKIELLESKHYYDTPFSISIGGVTYIKDLTFEQAKAISEIYNTTVINLALNGLPKEQTEEGK